MLEGRWEWFYLGPKFIQKVRLLRVELAVPVILFGAIEEQVVLRGDHRRVYLARKTIGWPLLTGGFTGQQQAHLGTDLTPMWLPCAGAWLKLCSLDLGLLLAAMTPHQNLSPPCFF